MQHAAAAFAAYDLIRVDAGFMGDPGELDAAPQHAQAAEDGSARQFERSAGVN